MSISNLYFANCWASAIPALLGSLPLLSRLRSKPWPSSPNAHDTVAVKSSGEEGNHGIAAYKDLQNSHLSPPSGPHLPETIEEGFLQITSRRPRHHLDISEQGYNVMYKDVDMVWLSDPFPYLEGHHDIYFTDDMAVVKPLNHSLGLPQPGKKGRTYILR
ncbi:uncharacterized protein LOC110023844 [Phalaenopsis equestris]|uniref:uncharacterized protein LOC110023844 n=1 Tax=Phalaenopsis equestris TaxID=78828 RepID=UPI0009E37F74|nr:uncharacterized protein LOC110023844 [Phalaenopsis equestris]